MRAVLGAFLPVDLSDDEVTLFELGLGFSAGVLAVVDLRGVPPRLALGFTGVFILDFPLDFSSRLQSSDPLVFSLLGVLALGLTGVFVLGSVFASFS
jgi:hypothetical protein